ncbi:MAG: 2-isopropylmalate synthase [Coriobacteriia bacterium]|nr:2-isopropylmalate synthase [Coriobacteriia bacterium]
MKNHSKYKVGYFMPPNPTTKWVTRDRVEKTPIWCSVDLRDGNQALIVPMSLEEKVEFFQFLVSLGFKEIEVGFPAASETEYALIRTLIEKDLIPEDVTIQVLTQSREHIIEKTFESLRGIKKAIVHLYNSTSLAQREQVFKMSKDEISEIAKEGATLFNKYAALMPETSFRFEYSPESFTGTEMEFALSICNEVIDIWKPTADKKVIINLPATVAMSMPHVYATQIEYMSDNLHDRENIIVSLHPHNDRGTAVADAELGLLAGADRVEGTLFGNGERTGNVDLITVAMNMFCHGVATGLDFSDMPSIVETYERFTNLVVHPRQPYGGSLVFAAFSGSHQDAIAKGMKWHEDKGLSTWSVPYLPIDPHDVGRVYEADVIRINSQSGKGGIAYILENNYGYDIPKAMKEEVGYFIKDFSDKTHKELAPGEVFDLFNQEYVNCFTPIDITDITFQKDPASISSKDVSFNTTVVANINGDIFELEGHGNGRLDATRKALMKGPYNREYTFVTYTEHALEKEADSMAVAYVAIADKNGRIYWGVGTHTDIIYASVNALVCAINRMNKVAPFIEK